MTDQLLRDLDVADPRVHSGSPRARATLERILLTSPAAPAPRRPAPARRRRVVLAAAAVAVLGAGGALVPALDGGDAAYATWTAEPEAVASVERADAGNACREQMRQGAGADNAAALAAAEVAVAEQRGTWTTVVLAGDGGFSALCVDDGSAGLFTTMFGSIGTPDVPAAGPRDVVATDLGVGATSAGELSLVGGLAGSDVTAVRLHSTSAGVVDASVSGGRFVLWFPGGELADAVPAGVELEVGYSDGTSTTVTVRL